MDLLYIFLIVVQAGVIVFLLWRSKRQQGKPQVDHYTAFRKQALSVSATQLKLNIPHTQTFIYGIVMDWDIGEAIVTIAAYVTGAASMYFSSGGGKTAGGLDPAVGEAAVDFVMASHELLNHAEAIDTAAPPVKGQVTFHFLTNQRMFRVQVPLAAFDDPNNMWTPLFQRANILVNTMHASGTVSAN